MGKVKASGPMMAMLQVIEAKGQANYSDLRRDIYALCKKAGLVKKHDNPNGFGDDVVVLTPEGRRVLQQGAVFGTNRYNARGV